jgi:hypothetical protein
MNDCLVLAVQGYWSWLSAPLYGSTLSYTTQTSMLLQLQDRVHA